MSVAAFQAQVQSSFRKDVGGTRDYTKAEISSSAEILFRLNPADSQQAQKWFESEYGKVLATDLAAEVANLRPSKPDAARILLGAFDGIDGIRNNGSKDGYIDQADLAVYIANSPSLKDQKAAQMALDNFNLIAASGQHSRLIEKSDLIKWGGLLPTEIRNVSDAAVIMLANNGAAFDRADGIRNNGAKDGYIDQADLAVFMMQATTVEKAAGQILLDKFSEIARPGQHSLLIEKSDLKRHL